MNNFTAMVQRSTRTVMKTIQKHAPEILVTTGVVAAVGATVMACRATLDVQEPLNESKKRIDDIKDMEEEFESDTEYKKELTKAYGNTALIVIKAYAPSAALGAAAIGTIFASNGIQRKRNASLTATIASVESMYNKYRNNVIDKYGEEEDRNLRLGLHKEKITQEEIDEETGKSKKVKSEELVFDPDADYGEFAIIFSPETNCAWNKSMKANEMWLQTRINWINDIMPARGSMTINDCLKELEFDREDTKIAGQVWGYKFNPDKVGNYCDIRYYRVFDKDGNPAFLIDFQNAEFLSDSVWGQGNNLKMKKMLSKYHK